MGTYTYMVEIETAWSTDIFTAPSMRSSPAFVARFNPDRDGIKLRRCRYSKCHSVHISQLAVVVSFFAAD